MTKYSFKENFFSTSTTAIDIYDEHNQAVFSLKLYYASTAQETFAWLGKKKHNFEITYSKSLSSLNIFQFSH